MNLIKTYFSEKSPFCYIILFFWLLLYLFKTNQIILGSAMETWMIFVCCKCIAHLLFNCRIYSFFSHKWKINENLTADISTRTPTWFSQNNFCLTTKKRMLFVTFFQGFVKWFTRNPHKDNLVRNRNEKLQGKVP